MFNGDWELIGLHHAGFKKTTKLNCKEGTYAANEDILLQAIEEQVQQLDLTS